MSVLADIRVKALARDIIRPPQKAGIGTRNLDFLRLVMADKSKSVLFTTFPSSGWNWAMDVAGCAVIKHLTGVYEIKYQPAEKLKLAELRPYELAVPADSRARNVPKLRETFPQIDVDYCFHTHDPWGKSALWGLDDAKTIMIARNIPTALYSYYAKRRQKFKSFEECLEKKGLMDWVIRYCNSWAVYKARHPERFHLFRYKEFRRDPMRNFSRLIETAFCLRVPDSILEEAIDYYSFEKQKQREMAFSADEKTHFHFKGQVDYREDMGDETYNLIVGRLRRDLTDNFGFDYSGKESS